MKNKLVVIIGAVALVAIAGFVGYRYFLTPNCLPASQAANHVGQHECVSFTVGSTDTSWSGNQYLDQYSDYTKGFSVYAPKGTVLNNPTLSGYQGKTVDATGTISLYKNAPQMIVSDQSQIRIAK